MGSYMRYFRMSRLTKLDVKWVGFHQGGNHQFHEWGNSNPNYELIMVTEGPIYLQVANQKLLLSSGECLLLEPWDWHKNWQELNASTGFFWVQFTPHPGFQAVSSNPLPLSGIDVKHPELRIADEEDVEHLILPQRFQPRRCYELLSMFEKLLQEMDQPKGYFRYRLSLNLGHIIEKLADDFLYQNKVMDSFSTSYFTYRHLVNYLNEHYNREISKPDIEQAMNRSYEYLCQLFKKNAGISMITYVQQLRNQRAKYLLAHRSTDIHEIAIDVGYKDPYYFSKVFKKLEGVSPSRYRQAHRKDE
ncbi:helix-turn-helix domain-containing protein [Paenibacillus koleovorans]|uniref:helix-turn-helix domain-containing protein n=1 Tax=Paenibacillus koleovorans TaxID=121608 RepID=UPI0013E2A8A7|nr:helix-turn-helix domain-containing protein [Paenibacillus koleovorans]